MKNLFAINKTDAKNAKNFDDNPYLAARVSEAVRARLDAAFDSAFQEPEEPELTADQQARKTKASRFRWIGVLCLVAALAGLLLAKSDEPNAVLDTAMIALLLVSTVLMFLSRRTEQKLQAELRGDRPEIDFSEATGNLQAAAEEAARELGVPSGAVSLEVLPYHYKLSGDKEVPVGKANHFDNIEVSAFVEDGALFLASAQELFRVPLTAIRGKRVYDEEFVVDFWLKEEESDSEAYAAYNVRRAGYLSRKCRTYYGVEIDGGYEFFVPCYDLDTLERLVTLQTIAD